MAPGGSWASSGGFGKARSHSSAATACRLNEIQNAGPKLEAKSSPAIPKSASQMRVVPMPMPMGEGSDHPTTVMDDVVATDGPDSKHQARQEPQAEHHRCTGLRQSAVGEPAAEDQREDTADHRRPGEHPTEPSMERVVTAAEPIGELERCPEEVQHTRREVQVGQPRLLHVAMVKLVLRQGAGGQIGHVDQEALDDRKMTIKRRTTTVI